MSFSKGAAICWPLRKGGAYSEAVLAGGATLATELGSPAGVGIEAKNALPPRDSTEATPVDQDFGEGSTYSFIKIGEP